MHYPTVEMKLSKTYASTNVFNFSGLLISTCATYSAGNDTLKNSYFQSAAALAILSKYISFLSGAATSFRGDIVLKRGFEVA
jgi:hypothetical protein